MPEWEFKLELLLENLDENLEINIFRNKESDYIAYEISKAQIPIKDLFPKSTEAILKIKNRIDGVFQY
jgi:hypothetical protein